MQRQAREFCHEQKRQNVIYSESRLCPHIFLERGLTPAEVIDSVLEGFAQGQEETGVKVRLILCFIKPSPGVFLDFSFSRLLNCPASCARVYKPEWSLEIAELAIQNKDRGVVGVDIAGDELAEMDERHVAAFQVTMTPSTPSVLTVRDTVAKV